MGAGLQPGSDTHIIQWRCVRMPVCVFALPGLHEYTVYANTSMLCIVVA